MDRPQLHKDIEGTVIQPSRLIKAGRKSQIPFTGGLNFENKKAIAELALHGMDDCVKFSESERNS